MPCVIFAENWLDRGKPLAFPDPSGLRARWKRDDAERALVGDTGTTKPARR